MKYSTLETNLLEKVIVLTEHSPEYTLRFKGKLLTLYRAEQLLAIMQSNKIKSKEMTIIQAKEKAINASRGSKKKFYVNVDDNGYCNVSGSFNTDATIYCYSNGSQVALDSKQQKKIDTQLNQTIMATVKSATKTKPTSNSKPAKAVKPAKKEPVGKGTKKTVTVSEIYKLLEKGHIVTTAGGGHYNKPYLDKTKDKKAEREVIVYPV